MPKPNRANADRSQKNSLWLWFAVPLLLLAGIAAALYLLGDGAFSGGSGYDVR